MSDTPSIFLVYGSPAMVVRLAWGRGRTALDYMRDAKIYRPNRSVHVNGRHVLHRYVPVAGELLQISTTTPGV